jgi:spermidine synthase
VIADVLRVVYLRSYGGDFMSNIDVHTHHWLNEHVTPWDIYSHGIKQILTHKQTPYQEMYIVETGVYGKALVLDGRWQSTTGDEFLYHESLVHPAMIAHGSPRKVLILGGGEGATVREVLRWKSVEQVVMIDIDGDVVEACRQHLPEMHQGAMDDPRCRVIIGDALDFLDTVGDRWDLVISDLAEPLEDGPAFQLFTKEYFEKVKRVLAPEGLFVVQAGGISPVFLKLHARLIRTLMAVFPNVHSYSHYVPTYCSNWGFALCSPHPIATRPVPEEIDRVLAEKTTGGFRMLDGMTLLSVLQTPLYVREAIAAETQVYTMANPPQIESHLG